MPPRTSLRHRVAHTLHRPFPFSISIGHHRPIPSSVLRALSLWAAIAIIIKLPNQKLVFPKLLWSTLSYAIGQNSLSLSLSLSYFFLIWPFFWLPRNWVKTEKFLYLVLDILIYGFANSFWIWVFEVLMWFVSVIWSGFSVKRVWKVFVKSSLRSFQFTILLGWGHFGS